MAVFRNKNGNLLMVDCNCGCNNGFKIRVDQPDDDMYVFLTYISGNFYNEQDYTFWRVFSKKLKKIWAIIRNKDYHYSEICMSKADFQEFQQYIKEIE